MAQEVSSEDGVLHVRNDERPSEGSTEAQVQAEGVHTISRDGRLVSSLQGGPCGGGGTVTTGGRNDAHLGTGVHKKAQAAVPVRDENRQLGVRHEVLVANSTRPGRFPTKSRGMYTSGSCPQSGDGTSKVPVPGLPRWGRRHGR